MFIKILVDSLVLRVNLNDENIVFQYEELETLYACVSKYAFEGLATYEKSAGGQAAGAATAAGNYYQKIGPYNLFF